MEMITRDHQSKIQITTLMLLGGALSERGGVVHDSILFNLAPLMLEFVLVKLLVLVIIGWQRGTRWTHP